MKSTYLLLTFSFLFVSKVTFSQPTFKNVTYEWWKSESPRSPIPAGIVDIDGDFSDEIVSLNRGNELQFFQYFDKEVIQLGKIGVSNNSQWTMTAGDFDNNGRNSVVTSGVYNNITLTQKNDSVFSNSTIISSIYAQGSNTIDINNDGLLDLFVCDDVGHPVIYLNQNGNLVQQKVIDFSQNDPTDGSGNYGSEWEDVNNDGLIDLYISKCRVGVDSPDDHRRINKLFINQGNNTFSNMSDSFNLANGAQSWTTTFGDLDNDGDMDAFLVNHEVPHVLYENIDGKFFVKKALSKPLQSFGFQVLMRDLDNDGLLDILISGIEGLTLLHNRGGMQFDIFEKFLSPSKILSFNVGDINDDGLIDIYGHISQPINEIGYSGDELWINTSQTNHFIKLNLIGTKSNRNAIGARIKVFTSLGVQQRTVKGGESYGIINSFQQHFGTDQDTKVDSVLIFWPSGITEKYFNLPTNETYIIEEGKCITSQSIRPSETIYVSSDHPVELDAASVPMMSHQWSNGDTSGSTSITIPGKYSVKMRDSLGCLYISKPIIAKNLCRDAVTPIFKNDAVTICSGDDLTLSAGTGKSYQWSNGSTSDQITVQEPGKYAITMTDFCDQTYIDTLKVKTFSPTFKIVGDTVDQFSSATLTSSSEKTDWYGNSDKTDFLFSGQVFHSQPLDTSQYFYAVAYDNISTSSGRLGKTDFPISNQYSADGIEGSLVFITYNVCKIKTVKVGTDKAGIRRVIIKRSNGEVIYSKDFDIPVGISEITLDALIEKPGEYRMGTDINVNYNNLGFKSPRLMRSQGGTNFPYFIEDQVLIYSSDGGQFYYYYFYDWKVDYDFLECATATDSVFVKVNQPDLTTSYAVDSIVLYPNPVHDELHYTQMESDQVYHIYTLQGIRVLSGNNHRISVSHLPSGMYIFELTSKNHAITRRTFIKL